jgi:hypothetical protein
VQTNVKRATRDYGAKESAKPAFQVQSCVYVRVPDRWDKDEGRHRFNIISLSQILHMRHTGWV